MKRTPRCSNVSASQLASDVRSGSSKLRKEPLETVFIRAPIIGSVGNGVEILAEDAGHPVLVQQGRVLAATFHPELTSDTNPIAHPNILNIYNGSSVIRVLGRSLNGHQNVFYVVAYATFLVGRFRTCR